MGGGSPAGGRAFPGLGAPTPAPHSPPEPDPMCLLWSPQPHSASGPGPFDIPSPDYIYIGQAQAFFPHPWNPVPIWAPLPAGRASCGRNRPSCPTTFLALRGPEHRQVEVVLGAGSLLMQALGLRHSEPLLRHRAASLRDRRSVCLPVCPSLLSPRCAWHRTELSLALAGLANAPAQARAQAEPSGPPRVRPAPRVGPQEEAATAGSWLVSPHPPWGGGSGSGRGRGRRRGGPGRGRGGPHRSPWLGLGLRGLHRDTPGCCSVCLGVSPNWVCPVCSQTPSTAPPNRPVGEGAAASTRGGNPRWPDGGRAQSQAHLAVLTHLEIRGGQWGGRGGP